jgi:hypothetical protein
MVTRDGRVKILDFGLAKKRRVRRLHVAPGNRLGSGKWIKEAQCGIRNLFALLPVPSLLAGAAPTVATGHENPGVNAVRQRQRNCAGF